MLEDSNICFSCSFLQNDIDFLFLLFLFTGGVIINNLIGSITGVWGDLMEWIMTALGDVQSIFYVAETGLTFLGTLAVIAVGIGVVFLVIGVIQSFLHLRG